MSKQGQSHDGLRNFVAELERGLFGAGSDAVKPGKQGLCPSHRRRVQVVEPWEPLASVDLDAAFKPVAPEAPRWDYFVLLGDGAFQSKGLSGKTYNCFIEFHKFRPREIESVLKKAEWVRDLFASRAPRFLNPPVSFHWVPPSGKHLKPPSQSRYAKKLAKARIRVGPLSRPQKGSRIPVWFSEVT